MTRTLTKAANKSLFVFFTPFYSDASLSIPPPHSSNPLSEQNAPISSGRSVTLFLFFFFISPSGGVGFIGSII